MVFKAGRNHDGWFQQMIYQNKLRYQLISSKRKQMASQWAFSCLIMLRVINSGREMHCLLGKCPNGQTKDGRIERMDPTCAMDGSDQLRKLKNFIFQRITRQCLVGLKEWSKSSKERGLWPVGGLNA